MGPTWVLSAPDGPHVGSMNLAIRVLLVRPDYYGMTTFMPCLLVTRIFHDDVINGNIFLVTGPLCGEFTGDR